MASPWQPTLAIKATLALHAAALAGCVLVPTLWPWALGVLVVNHAIITTAGLLPRTTLLGPNLTRLPDSAVARREIAI
ncbi:MAG TPA: polysaccharide deacetylase family protein, partial [Casimicrobium huifangae]|nr:polysaccharide deacetylase family protein [Casimicrobium huifangae]